MIQSRSQAKQKLYLIYNYVRQKPYINPYTSDVDESPESVN
jgi:hypothetical protein